MFLFILGLFCRIKVKCSGYFTFFSKSHRVHLVNSVDFVDLVDLIWLIGSKNKHIIDKFI